MAIRHVFETETGLIIATTLHSLGAIGVIAALGTHLAWLRAFRAGEDRKDLEAWTFWLTSTSVVANLVGGFMRTYLPGHPTLKDIAHSPWVQVVLLKHAFIFAALGGLIWLHHFVTPRLRRDGLSGRTPLGHDVGVYLVVVGVIVASVLGAMAQISPLGAGFDPEETVTVHTDDGRFIQYTNATGALTSTPVQPQEATGTFLVPLGAASIQVKILYDNTFGELQLRIEAPDGTDATGIGIGGQLEVEVPPPMRGLYTYRISADTFAVETAWEISIRVASAAADETLLVETFTIPPGTFFEINTQMPGNASFHWDWVIEEGTAVAFDVHSHFDGEVQYLVEKTAAEDRGSFTNDREGGYSLLWENTGAAPVTLVYRVWGDFEVDSYFPPR